jgi:cell division protein FtsQ
MLGAVSFMYIFCHDLITQSSYLKAKYLKVIGINRLSETQILQDLGIYPGINILSVNLTKVRKQLLSNTWISEAEVRRHLPDRITITITEQEPLAVLDLGRKFVINNKGDIFKEWTDSDPGNLPVVTGLRYSDITISGESRTASFQAAIEFLTVATASADFLPASFFQHIHVDREIGITLHIPEGESDGFKTVKLGYGRFQEKFKRLNAVLIYLNDNRDIRDFDTIDLNDLDRIVVNPGVDKASLKSQKEV